jgi:hypothetical protein
VLSLTVLGEAALAVDPSLDPDPDPDPAPAPSHAASSTGAMMEGIVDARAAGTVVGRPETQAPREVMAARMNGVPASASASPRKPADGRVEKPSKTGGKSASRSKSSAGRDARGRRGAGPAAAALFGAADWLLADGPDRGGGGVEATGGPETPGPAQTEAEAAAARVAVVPLAQRLLFREPFPLVLTVRVCADIKR